MDRLIWTAVSGMSASMARQRMIANNMANTQTVGFRAETMQFTPMTLTGPSLGARALSDGAVRGASMQAGSISQTGRALDVAMQGDTLLGVSADDGTEAYTRRGDLTVDPAGVLVNGDGVPVLGEGGPISVPPGAVLEIAPDGAITMRDPAAPDAPPQVLDRLRLVSPAGTAIAKGLDGLFRVVGGGVLPPDAEARVTPAALEGSNVSASGVLVDMIEAQRLFDMRTKLIATARDLDAGGAQLMKLT